MTHPSVLPHPDADQISLANVLGALSDQTRLAIISQLACNEEKGALCGQFTDLASKTAITYHIAKLREAGVVRVTAEGTRRRVRLRRDDLDARFPGVLDSIIANTRGLELQGFEAEE
ncbi:MAG TPA: helix-turn-helix domain-containing protein [Devosia sp.]|nr:helix-turn-helix domain-containing protein [Devosia sp.]